MFNVGEKVRMKRGGMEGIVVASYPMANMTRIEFGKNPALRHTRDDVELEPIPKEEPRN